MNGISRTSQVLHCLSQAAWSDLMVMEKVHSAFDMILIILVTTNTNITGKALSRLQSCDFELYRARQGESCCNSHPACRMHDRGLPCQHGWLCVEFRVWWQRCSQWLMLSQPPLRKEPVALMLAQTGAVPRSKCNSDAGTAANDSGRCSRALLH